MRASSPRYHRENLPPPDQNFDSGGGGGVVTLEGIRPHPRLQNEYVDTPKPHPLLANVKSVTLPTGGGGIGGSVPLPSSRTHNNGIGRLNLHINSVISTQPSSPPLKKDPDNETVQLNSDSIICQRCGKCRCGACTEPRELPSKWMDICGDKIKVDPESIVNVCTCFCCVKGLFYHCNNDPDAEYESYSDPCACCSRPNCCTRWTCIALMSLCLPCLCFYWPAKGGLHACTTCYNKCTRRKGCQCRKVAEGSRRLLIDPDSSST